MGILHRVAFYGIPLAIAVISVSGVAMDKGDSHQHRQVRPVAYLALPSSAQSGREDMCIDS